MPIRSNARCGQGIAKSVFRQEGQDSHVIDIGITSPGFYYQDDLVNSVEKIKKGLCKPPA